MKIVGIIGSMAVFAVSGIWAAGWNASGLYGEIDNIKKNMPPAGTLQIIQDRIEQQGERIKRIEQGVEQQADDRRRMMELMQNQGQKVDRVFDILMRERRGKDQ